MLLCLGSFTVSHNMSLQSLEFLQLSTHNLTTTLSLFLIVLGASDFLSHRCELLLKPYMNPIIFLLLNCQLLDQLVAYLVVLLLLKLHLL